MKKKPFMRRVGDFLLGKGFYMVLLLCVLAIGGSGYYLWWLAGQELETETPSVAANAPAEVEVETETGDTDDREAAEQIADALAEAAEQEAEAQEETARETADAAAEEAAAQEPVQESQETGETAEPAAETVQTETEPVAETAAEEAVQMAKPEEDSFTAPVSGEAVAAFSDSELTYNAALEDWRTHNGVDLAAQVGEEVYAALDGEVLSVENDPLLGTVITLNHGDGLMTIYGNLSEEVAVRQGDKVSAGQVIGTVGETAAGETNEGGWLHFAVKKDGVLVDPIEYLG
ncbi:MAG: peptidoglycan DD-metalloendopeptidase family protein [Clostridiales bacterium]|nr:peptidoglycan DD-metalloendopeptidase family protein [Clostridiales bacterium]